MCQIAWANGILPSDLKKKTPISGSEDTSHASEIDRDRHIKAAGAQVPREACRPIESRTYHKGKLRSALNRHSLTVVDSGCYTP
ncbi:hypothetical protein EVAR_94978_1 [Eumeta japonica]|uniref:Uncharacterized protein n=1 Tax=Eumeta variegata TaxID=151549 RepID=A0A4C1UUG0_EUMVA|nr:hypothetical protein EVAR_94978_1 [Eumeta japonica]